MELIILNEDLETIGIIDAFESLLWSDKYFEYGEFELLTLPNNQNISLVTQGCYASIEESEHLMIIEDINIKTDPVEGNRLIVKGRSLESILDRRIILDPIELYLIDINTASHGIIDINIINPSNLARKINLLEFEDSTDPLVLGPLVSNQYWGDSIYKVILDLCVNNGIGFKITLTDAGKFKFKLYAGVDRSYEQIDNPYVVFSPSYENLKNSNYIFTTRLLRNVCLVAGEKGVGNAQIATEVDPSEGSITDLSRREMFLDAQDVTKVDENGNPISDNEYISHLRQKGFEELGKNVVVRTFASEVDPISNFVFGKEFFLGDILQVSNEFGFEGRCRVIEVTYCQDGSGYKIYPIFSATEHLNISETVDLKYFSGLYQGVQEAINLEKVSNLSVNDI